MAAVDERVWLVHPGTGGYFYCPAGAAAEWCTQGWEPTDTPPAEPNPVVAERIAWESAQASLAANEAAPKTKTKAAPRGDTEES